MKRTTITKDTKSLNASSATGIIDEDVVNAREDAAVYLKWALEGLNEYIKYFYGFSIHALGYTNFNP